MKLIFELYNKIKPKSENKLETIKQNIFFNIHNNLYQSSRLKQSYNNSEKIINLEEIMNYLSS